MAEKDIDKLLSLTDSKYRLSVVTAKRALQLRSGVSVGDLTPRLAEAGLRTLIFTDVTRDGTLRGLDRDLMRQVRGLWRGELIVGGGVADTNDVRLLAEEGIEGAIVGRAIYEGTLPYPVRL